jgi:tetratricopeptide (TPR) repeat protein
MAKQMFVTLPFLLLLLDYWPLERVKFIPSYFEISTGKPESKPFTSLLLEKLPLFILAIGSSIITYFVQKKSGALNTDTPLMLNIGNGIISYIRYIGMMFWPHPLAAIYPFNPDQINYLNVIAALGIILTVSCFALWQTKKRPYFLMGWLWYLGTLVPVIGFVRIGDHALADRYTYLPLIGLFVTIIWGGHELIERLRSHKKALAVALSITVLSILSLMTIQQTRYWKNDFVLFQHTIDVTGNNAPAHRRLGQAYGSIMNVEKATSEYKIARLLHYQYLEKIKPNDFEVHYMLGTSYLELQRYDEAIREYLFSLNLNDKNPKLYNNLGIAYYHTGNILEAKRAFVQASLIDPGNKEALHNLDAIEKKPEEE